MTIERVSSKKLTLKLKDKTSIYNSYMPFLEYGGLFVPSENLLHLGEEVLLTVEIGRHPPQTLPVKTAWLNQSGSAEHPQGIGLAFMPHEACRRVQALIEDELGGMLRSDYPTYTL